MRVRSTATAFAAAAVLVGAPTAALAATADGGAITGNVWLDLDGDGVRSDAEPGRADVSITLRTSATILDATMTDEDGTWSFGNVQPGTYTVVVEAPIDLVVTGGTMPGLDTGDGTGTVTVTGTDTADGGDVGLGSPVSTGPDVTATVTLDRAASTEEAYRWSITAHDIGPAAAPGPIDVRMVLSADHETTDVGGDGWACEQSAAIVLCQTDAGIAAGTSLPRITLTTRPIGAVGTNITVTGTVRLDGAFDAAPLNDEDSAAAAISTELAAADLDGDGTGDLTDAGAAPLGALVVALLALLAGAATLRTTRQT